MVQSGVEVMMGQYKTIVRALGERAPLPTAADPLRTHREVIRAIFLLYPDAEVELFAVTNNNGRTVMIALDPMPTWTR